MRPSLSDQTYEAIKSDIMSCALRPGQQIAQNQLAEKYQAGLTPVREALQRLAQEGFVQAIPRFGYVVTPLTLSDIRDLFEMRAVLEAAAARLAATRASTETLQQIAAVADQTADYRNGQSVTNFELNAEFHRRVAQAAGNQRLALALQRQMDELLRVFNLGLDLQESGEAWREEHMALAAALLRRDAEAAEQLARAQVLHSQQRVLDALTHSSAALAGQSIQLSPVAQPSVGEGAGARGSPRPPLPFVPKGTFREGAGG